MQKYADITSIIDAPYVIRIILVAEERSRERGWAMASDFLEVTKNTRISLDVAYGLETHGVFDIELITTGKRMYKIRMTEKGTRLAASLRQAVGVFMEPDSGGT